MNLSDSSFLCLDIGSFKTTAFGVRVKNGRIYASAIHTFESSDPVAATVNAIGALESDVGKKFDGAFITGNFGQSEFSIARQSTDFGREHKITNEDITAQVRGAIADLPDTVMPLHIIPLRYDIGGFPNIAHPAGQNDRILNSAFGIIAAERSAMAQIHRVIRAVKIETNGFYDTDFLIANTAKKKKQTAAIVGIGAEYTTVSVWTARGPVAYQKFPFGLARVAEAIVGTFGISMAEASRLMKSNLSLETSEMDRFAPADIAYDFSKAELNDIAAPFLEDSVRVITDFLEKYTLDQVFLHGGGANIVGLDKIFNAPVRNLGSDAGAQALAAFIWKREAAHAKAWIARHARFEKITDKIFSMFRFRKKKKRFIPIMPSTQAFDMDSPQTYKLFDSAGISMIHVDIMDGFFVNRIVGGIEQLRKIRGMTSAKLNVHLMTESPLAWAEAAADAGADTITVSAGTAGVRAAIARIKDMGKRAGVALYLESSVDILKPILREIDEVLIMSIAPGPIGQEFIPDALYKVSTLANTRKKYGLKFKISVDGGINNNTAKKCWNAGADYLVSGSYLSNASDFPLAVMSLLPAS